MAMNFNIPRDANNVAVARPLDAFVVMDQDVANDVQYYGMLSHDGAWFIQQIVQSAGTFRFQHGHGDYTSAWTLRESLTYDLWDGI